MFMSEIFQNSEQTEEYVLGIHKYGENDSW